MGNITLLSLDIVSIWGGARSNKKLNEGLKFAAKNSKWQKKVF